jgi:hypothetical protein
MKAKVKELEAASQADHADDSSADHPEPTSDEPDGSSSKAGMTERLKAVRARAEQRFSKEGGK